MKRLLWIAALLIAAVRADALDRIGNVASFTKTAHGVAIATDRGNVELTVYREGIVRIRASFDPFRPDSSFAVVRDPGGEFTRIADGAGALELSAPGAKITVAKRPFRLHIADGRGNLLNEDDQRLGIVRDGGEIACYKRLFPGERFIGLGEKVGNIDRRGNAYVDWNTDHYAYSEKDDPLYTSLPFYIGIHDSALYGIFFDNTFRATFDFGASTDDKTSSFSAAGGEMNYYLFTGASPAELIEKYTWLTGRMPVPPRWALGYQQCRWSYYPDREVLDLARTFRAKKIPADVIYLDIHYMDGYKIFTWNPERFPHPAAMIDSLRAMGFHLVTIVDPGIKIEPGYFAYDEGIAKNYFITYPGGEPYTGSVWPGRCHFPDFTRAEVRKWWGSSLGRLAEPGVTGFWNDMNEPAVWGQHIPGLVGLGGAAATMNEAHNVYGLEMARGSYEGARALMNGNRPFILTRAAYAGVQRYSAVWTGDNVPSDEHMLLAVRLVQSMGIAGVPFTGPDIGGFSGDATPELFTRWLSIGTYTPFFRNHKQFGMRRQEPWSFGEDVEATARRAIEERYRLMPYIYSLFDESARTGIPVARALALGEPFDGKSYEFQNEYLFGENILVAPVASTEKTAHVWFPKGGWYRMGSDAYYDGGSEATVDAPLDDLPVFARAGGVIPMQSAHQHDGDLPSDTLFLHCYAGKHGSPFTMYDDDGHSYAYESGTFSRRQITFDPAARRLTLEQAEGSFLPQFKTVRVVLHGFAAAKSASVNGRRILADGKGFAFPYGIPRADERITVTW